MNKLVFFCFFVIPGIAFGIGYYLLSYYAIGAPLWQCLLGGLLFSIVLNNIVVGKGEVRYRALFNTFGTPGTGRLIFRGTAIAAMFMLMYVLNQYRSTGMLFSRYFYYIASTGIAGDVIGILFILKAVACNCRDNFE